MAEVARRVIFAPTRIIEMGQKPHSEGKQVRRFLRTKTGGLFRVQSNRH